MPDPEDLQERLAAMAERRAAGADRPAHLPARSRQRIRRGERIVTGLAALVALVAGGVALARSGQEQATTVRVGQPSGSAACDPVGIPRIVAEDLRQLARTGQPIPGATPKAVAVAIPDTASQQLTINVQAFGGGWALIITGLHFAPWDMGPTGIDPNPHSNGESVLLGHDLLFDTASSGPVPADLADLHPVEVSLDPGCDRAAVATSESSSSTTVPPASSTSTTPGATTPVAPIGRETPPDCTGSQLSLTATTDKASYAIGDTVTITVTIRNRGATCENASRAAAIDTCPLIRVANAADQAVYDPGVFCSVPLAAAPVPSGYHRSVTFRWPSGQDPQPCADPACVVKASPGTYTVTPSDGAIDGIQIHPTTIRIT